jgi:hypothetical protein
MDWRVVVLTAADSAIGGMSVIQGLFDRIWMALRAQKDMALFARSPMGDLIFARDVFLTGVRGPVRGDHSEIQRPTLREAA